VSLPQSLSINLGYTSSPPSSIPGVPLHSLHTHTSLSLSLSLSLVSLPCPPTPTLNKRVSAEAVLTVFSRTRLTGEALSGLSHKNG
jgi:hypothetical protein